MRASLAWDVSFSGVFVAVAAVIAAVLAARFYARSSARTSAVLRGVALGLLAITALRPTLRYAESAATPRPVRVIVDDSLSMGVIDSGLSAGRRLRLAAAMGQFDDSEIKRALHDADTLRGRLDELRQAKDALAAARTKDAIAAAQRQRVKAASDAAIEAARQLADSAEEIGCSAMTTDGLRRTETPIVDEGDAGPMLGALDDAMTDLRQRTDAEFERAAATDPDAAEVVGRWGVSTRFDTATVAARRLADVLPGGATFTALDGRVIEFSPTLAPAAASTPLTAALRDACVRAAAERADGVVLLSDGRSTESRSLLASAAAAGVAVYPVNVAPDDRSPDARVSRLTVRSAALAGQPLLVRVRVAQRNAAGRPARVVVTDGAREVMRTVTLGNDNTFDFVWPDARSPRVTLTARIDALDGESRLQNNAATIDAAVYDRRQKVTIVAGDGSRDVAECQDALRRAAWADVRRITPVVGSARTLDFSAVRDADLIVLADVFGDAMPEAAWAAIDRAVRVNGASLVVLAGQGEWLADPAVARYIAAALPTTSGPQPAWVSPPAKVYPVPTRFGIETPYLRLDESGDASQRAWLGRAKLSRVLTVGPPRESARVLLADRTTQAPVMIESAAGAGRIVLMLADEAWRWSTADAPDAARRFWQDLSQAVVDLPYDVSGDGLSLALDTADAPAGRNVGVRARAARPDAGPVSMNVSHSGVIVATPNLRETLPGGGRWTATLNLPPGTYDVTLRQGTRSVRTPFTVRADTQQELTDTTPDPGLLKRIADATGGVTLAADEIGRLPDLIRQRRERTTQVATYELWCSPYWFAMIVACLGLEWAMRPRAGLA